ncbi:MAG: bifunctional ADP-dependent (S)-NAD(P)H-hydrate dehydratase/NAD(P)H-hydrate epimerase [Desulfobacteraceae bacterium 4484_190.3]|nr:MAG: bifunctional ADP-dependent (S)-NAD(P)H-hydrate dehydratase/NAD(P)H-hydrate epimerase [Desulfobacteraceae bacterium 4484_190.3]
MKVCSVSEIRSMDRNAIEKFGIKDELLMENAALATYSVIQDEFGIKGKKFVVFCGAGNNGGDGCVVARKLHSNGGDVTVFTLGDMNKLTGAAKMNFNILSKIPLEIQKVGSAESIRTEVLHCDAVVDAIFGTGLAREVGGIYREIIQLINESKKKVFSVDIPSGVNGDTGEILGVAVKADYTVTFGLPKRGNILYPGYEQCGKLYVTHISFPPALYEDKSVKVEINDPVSLPSKDKKAHKGDFGEALFIAGAASYFGAPYFAAMSFLKGGGGYARLAAPISIIPFIGGKGSEIVFIPQNETGEGSISPENEDQLLKLAEKMDMVVIGPGLSLNEETQHLVRKLVREIKKPILIDGDGITAISQDLAILSERSDATILTPHLGEMSRITKLPVEEIDRNKIDVLQRTSKELNSIIVLKGAHSLTGYPDGGVFINMSGNPGMATAGSGDILTGTVAAMFGMGQSVEDAVRTGVFIHGLSGDLAARDIGEDGMTAGDILDYLPYAVKIIRDGDDEELKDMDYYFDII